MSNHSNRDKILIKAAFVQWYLGSCISTVLMFGVLSKWFKHSLMGGDLTAKSPHRLPALRARLQAPVVV